MINRSIINCGEKKTYLLLLLLVHSNIFVMFQQRFSFKCNSINHMQLRKEILVLKLILYDYIV